MTKGVKLKSPSFFLFKFLLGLVALIGLSSLPAGRPFIDGASSYLAAICAAFLRVAGVPAAANGAVLSAPDNSFAMRILDGCNALNVVCLVIAAILASPVRWLFRLGGMISCLIAIQMLNLFRLLALFHLGRHHTDLFVFAHEYFFEAVMVFAALGLFLLWLEMSLKFEVNAL